MTEETHKPNRLINETSPYLLQHAYNPVDWYPWSTEALDKAVQENKPILLSIGYSACHWCHVMERESFEDDEIAEIMNKHYVCVKVDREERPDLDKVYQIAHQMYTQRAGGWPLTVFLTPDEHTPIFAGTYFPDTPRQGMPSFGDLLERIAEHYQAKKNTLNDHNRVMKEAFSRLRTVASDSDLPLDESLLAEAVQELSMQYDPVYGGFGEAPKFPHPTQVALLLAFGRRRDANAHLCGRAINMAVHTLEAMANGGLYDHVAGGFSRYSVDSKWEIPHFEKMLYDNAQLIPLYVDAGIEHHREDFIETATRCADWAMRDMQSPAGGYYSTLDADSEGEEGKFYVWNRDELKTLLTVEELKAVDIRFGLRGTPNFEGKWHLRIENSLSVVAQRTGWPESQIPSILDKARRKMFIYRSKRVPPGRDEKILTSWNGLMIKAMAHTGRLLNRDDFVESAGRALDFARKRLWRDGRLLATAKDDVSHLNAYLDDYIFLADGVLELLQARWRDEEFRFALDLIEVVMTHYMDEDSGSFHFTSDDHETLLFRSIPTHDEATPSGNGVAAQLLVRAGHILGETRYLKAADRTMHALHPAATQMPSAFGSLLSAIEETLNPAPILVLRGEVKEMRQWAADCVEKTAGHLTVLPIPSDARDLPGLLVERKAGDSTVAYLCHKFTCAPPFDSLEELLNSVSDPDQVD